MSESGSRGPAARAPKSGETAQAFWRRTRQITRQKFSAEEKIRIPLEDHSCNRNPSVGSVSRDRRERDARRVVVSRLTRPRRRACYSPCRIMTRSV